MVYLWQVLNSSYEILAALIITSDRSQDERAAWGDSKWSEQDWSLRERCSALGATLDSRGDAAKRCQLVLSSRLRGKSETPLKDEEDNNSKHLFLKQPVIANIMKCALLLVFMQQMLFSQFLFFSFLPHSSSSSFKTSLRECSQRHMRLRSSWTV